MSSNIVQLSSKSPKKKREKYRARPDGYKCTRVLGHDLYARTDAELDQKVYAYKRQLAEGVRADRLKDTVSVYAAEWLATYKSNLKPKTQGSYKRDIDIILEFIGQRRLCDVTRSDIQRIINSRAGMSKSAIHKTIMTANALFAAAVADRVISVSPCTGLQRPDGSEGSHVALLHDQVQLIASTWREHQLGPAVMFMLFAGLRRGEAMALEVSRDVNIGKGQVSISRAITWVKNQPVYGSTKTSSGVRTVPLFAPLLEVVTETKGLLAPDHRTAQRQKPLTETMFKDAWNSYKQFVSMPDLQTHDLRHTFCSMGYDAGVDVKTMQSWLGHTDPAVTMRIYTHLLQTRKSHSEELAGQYLSQYIDEPDLINVEK